MGRLAPPEPAVYEKLETVLRIVEEQGASILAEHGVKVRVEHNRVESSRGGRFPYLTFRAVGLIEPDNDDGFVCTVCGDPGTTQVAVRGEYEPRCDEHEDLTGAPT